MSRHRLTFFAFLLWSPLVLAQITNEAETATLSGGALVADCPYCSGGKKVINIGGPENGAVTFTNVIVAETGLYSVKVKFDVHDDRAMEVTVNNEAIPQWFTFRRRGRHGGSTTIQLPLRAGANTIRFDNPREPGPDLDSIVVDPVPVKSYEIRGEVTVGAKVMLSGDARRITDCDSSGYYEFSCLPKGIYYVTPMCWQLSPGSRFYNIPEDVSRPHPHYFEEDLGMVSRKTTVLEWKRWRIDLMNGANIFEDGVPLLSNVYSEVRLPRSVISLDLHLQSVTERAISNELGDGREFTVEYWNSPVLKLTQLFSTYPDFMIVQIKVLTVHTINSRFIAPLVSLATNVILPEGDNRALFVPFDNDKWVRYAAVPFGGWLSSDEVSAFYNCESGAGLIVGSIDHDIWKTGVDSITTPDSISELEVYGGLASPQTRDTLPHGAVSGTEIVSPRIFIGRFSDWRKGLEAYAAANAAVTPPALWTNGVPFGWNSWGRLKFNLDYDKAIKVSDFFASELQPRGYQDDGVAYIGLDAGWNNLSDEQLKAFVQHCHANHQQAGIYCTPWAHFGGADQVVEGTTYHYSDLYLRAHGQPQKVDGGIALDPTHPGTRARLQLLINKFKQAGFTYLKIDFLTHGALEADQHFDPSITTGMQAFNSGMKFLRQLVGNGMYLNEAISPVFPACYAQSRRIACDAFGGINETEYTLNALTGGWWLNGVYRFLDPDHIVLQGFSEAENRSRITSAAIIGLMTSGDDLTSDGERALHYLTNPEIDTVAREPKFFRPIEDNTGAHAANIFAGKSGNDFCVAVFNYSGSPTNIAVDLRRAGWVGGNRVNAREVWTGMETNVSGTLAVHLEPNDAALYKIREKP